MAITKDQIRALTLWVPLMIAGAILFGTTASIVNGATLAGMFLMVGAGWKAIDGITGSGVASR